MQLLSTLALLTLASTAFSLPNPTKPCKSSTTKKPSRCTTTYTVTTSYPPRGVKYTTTVYTELIAVPRDLPCNGCTLKIVTKTINSSRKPDATVTATTAGLLQPPICFDFPTV
ncbi:hypothetical protein TWF173_005128 [Orbilia oligospora]|uniref:Uncharacterized protein n=2 Tax=Orbilia oligospora TaxID=2813651 RepID=G1XQR8_ARTOA|nr:hypothetical protein AOL_s00188g280 [Orbilia oligospora ATCC 24927]EGX44612.1 hypothetical protein AOL_s00188g280 [Orbilia oligospora ATCC 24927]KAF3280472.1 hypothetical protein TWF970_002693 [Orbilia oligospora]KAF3314023.1 hypothetical protein TWF173_005128 [Orbilia oligospora]